MTDTTESIVSECNRLLSLGLTHVQLLIARTPPRGQRVRLLGRTGPLGEFIAEVDGGFLATFRADEILKALINNDET